MDTFFRNLERALNATGLKWRDLSRLSGVSESSISLIRNGKQEITITRAERLAKSLGYEFCDIASRDFQPRPSKKTHAEAVVA